MLLEPGVFSELVATGKAECMNRAPDTLGRGLAESRRICLEECTITDDCLEYALAHTEVGGVWGGLDDAERESYARSTGQTALADALQQALHAAGRV